jgi:hypothetical protein
MEGKKEGEGEKKKTRKLVVCGHIMSAFNAVRDVLARLRLWKNVARLIVALISKISILNKSAISGV